MKRKTSAIFLATVLALAAGFCLFAAGSPGRLELFLNGTLVYSGADFQVVDGARYLPLPESAQALGVEAAVYPENRLVFLRYQGSSAILEEGTREVRVGGQAIPVSRALLWKGPKAYLAEEIFPAALARIRGADIRVAFSSSETAPSPAPSPSPATAARNLVDLIAIDAGHGGHDPGAKGPDGLQEKDVTLTLALKLRDRLIKEKGLEVYLTRDGDTFLPLRDRPAKALARHADVFVCVHANAARRLSAQGFETFFASLTATDKEALDLAALENREDSNQPAPPSVNNDLQAILGDMLQTEWLADSQRLSEMIQAELSRVMNSDNRGVKQAPFRVLMDSAMPAVLVEVGFITSPAESKTITDPKTQDLIVEAIATALLKYRDQTNARMGPSKP